MKCNRCDKPIIKIVPLNTTPYFICNCVKYKINHINIINLLSSSDQPLSASAISKKLNFTTKQTMRYLYLLTNLGIVDFHEKQHIKGDRIPRVYEVNL